MIAEGVIPENVVLSESKTTPNTLSIGLSIGIQCSKCGIQIGVFGCGFEEYSHNRMLSVVHDRKCRCFCKSDFRLSGGITRAGKAFHEAVDLCRISRCRSMVAPDSLEDGD